MCIGSRAGRGAVLRMRAHLARMTWPAPWDIIGNISAADVGRTRGCQPASVWAVGAHGGHAAKAAWSVSQPQCRAKAAKMAVGTEARAIETHSYPQGTPRLPP